MAHPIIKRENYNTACLSTFEILSAYIADMFYNKFYSESINYMNSKKSPSITAGYQVIINSYVNAIKNPENMQKIVRALNTYYQAYSNYSSMTFKDFINSVIIHLVPDKFHNDMSDDNKYKTICKIVSNVLVETMLYISEGYINNIIDNHNEKNGMHMKDHIVNLFLIEREKLFSSLIKGMSAPMVPRDVVEKLQQNYQSTIRRLNEKLQQNNNAANVQLLNKINALYLNYKKKCEELTTENVDLRKQITDLQNKNVELATNIARVNNIDHQITGSIDNLDNIGDLMSNPKMASRPQSQGQIQPQGPNYNSQSSQGQMSAQPQGPNYNSQSSQGQIQPQGPNYNSQSSQGQMSAQPQGPNYNSQSSQGQMSAQPMQPQGPNFTSIANNVNQAANVVSNIATGISSATTSAVTTATNVVSTANDGVKGVVDILTTTGTSLMDQLVPDSFDDLFSTNIGTISFDNDE
jgi:hypothetical protein